MQSVSIYEAKTRLSALIQAVESGEEVVITNRNRPVARLVPAGPPRERPVYGAAREAFERMYFEYHLAKDGGNMTRLAEKTGLERTHLYRKLKDLGLR